MARYVSNKKNNIYLTVLMIGYVCGIIAFLVKYLCPTLDPTAGNWLYVLFGIFGTGIPFVVIFYPQIEIYTGKTYTTYSHIILSLEILLFIFAVLTMIFANPTFLSVRP